MATSGEQRSEPTGDTVTFELERFAWAGPERLEVGGRSHGPYRLVVGAPGTIPT